jgi:hypothetical protein
MDIRLRPNNDYLRQANWRELYILTNYWKSDMEFYRAEISFLMDLIEKYFTVMIKEENIYQVQKLDRNLNGLQRELNEILRRIERHMHLLEGLIKDAFTHDGERFRYEHELLEDQYSQFIESFKHVKKSAFSITEYTMGLDKIKLAET